MKTTLTAVVCCLAISAGCQQPTAPYQQTGYVERLHPALDALVSKDAKADIIATGYRWSEGPLWVESHNMLLFSDVPKNTIYKWTEREGTTVYLTPSGYTDTVARGGETGANGITLDKQGNLILTQCGNRQIAMMMSRLDAPQPSFKTLAGNYDGKRFNSPNDVTMNNRGDIFFTDPPYGLEKGMTDPKKETPYQGVYRITPQGQVTLLVDSLTRPNGIAFLPGDKTLLVANSDPFKPNWYAYDIDEAGNLSNARIFATAKGADRTWKGLPDGMKVDSKGNVFATAPGGVWIFDSTGQLLGRLRVDETPVSNISFSKDEKTLYATSGPNILRFRLKP